MIDKHHKKILKAYTLTLSLHSVYKTHSYLSSLLSLSYRRRQIFAVRHFSSNKNFAHLSGLFVHVYPMF